MRRILAAAVLGGLLALSFAAPVGATSAATETVHASSNGGLVTVTAPASATAWRIRAGRAGHYLDVVLRRSGPHWSGSIRWEDHTPSGTHVSRTISLTSFLRDKADALGGCDMV